MLARLFKLFAAPLAAAILAGCQPAALTLDGGAQSRLSRVRLPPRDPHHIIQNARTAGFHGPDHPGERIAELRIGFVVVDGDQRGPWLRVRRYPHRHDRRLRLEVGLVEQMIAPWEERDSQDQERISAHGCFRMFVNVEDG